MKASKAALFASGVFFGGAVDHAILVAMRRDVTPYGVKAGVSGNALFAVADLIVAGVLYFLLARVFVLSKRPVQDEVQSAGK